MSHVFNSNQNSSKNLAHSDENVSKAIQNAKSLIMECGASGDSLLNHLSNIISKVIDERPENVVDYFEQFSEQVRHETFFMNENLLEEAYKEPERLVLAQKNLPQLIENLPKPSKNEENDEKSEEVEEEEDGEDETASETSYPKNFYELQTYWNLLGIGFPPEEVFNLNQAMKKIEKNPLCKSFRFWGKFFGLKNDYYVVECSLTSDGVDGKIDEIETEINNMSFESKTEPLQEAFSGETSFNFSGNLTPKSNNESRTSDFNEKPENFPPGWNFSMKVAESQYRPPVEIPTEEPGCGINRYVYFVSTDLNDQWVELPSVTPHQINVSRRIKKYLTGNLNENILSYPKFPGTEKNYLRTLIARISASTSVAPRNYYTIESEMESEEEEEEESEKSNDRAVKPNPLYRPLPIEKLLKLNYWEHFRPEILKQGRVKYFDGNILNMEEDEDMETWSEVSSEKGDGNLLDPVEIPLTLFAACSGDRLITEEMGPWTLKLSDVDEKLVLAQSRIWPGAFAFAKEKICDHIYIGYGHKFWTRNYSPPPIPQLSTEFNLTPEMVETNDPTVDEEEIFAKVSKNIKDDDENDEDQVIEK